MQSEQVQELLLQFRKGGNKILYLPEFMVGHSVTNIGFNLPHSKSRNTD